MQRSQRPRYAASNLPGDLLAGMTLWAVFSAQALAYSRLAHATPAAGLVTAVAGAAVYALLGSSRRNSIGPAGAIAAIVGATMASVPKEHLASSIAALTIMTAGLLFVGWILRLYFVQRLFPAPVFVGYLAGTGVSILVGQSKELVGHGMLPFAIGLASVIGVFALKYLAPRVPGPFAVLLVMTVASVVFGFTAKGVPVIGANFGRFGALTWPSDLGPAGLRPLIGPALSLALLVYADALANGEALAKKEDPPIRARREFFALGAVNLVAGLFGGFVAGCSTSRSLVGIKSGERTKLASGIASVLLLLTALSVVRLLGPLPLAALAGVVLVAAIDLIDVKHFREFWALRRADFWIALVTAAVVVIVGPIWGVGVGVLAALAEVFRRAMQPPRTVVSTHTSPDRYYEPFSPSSLPVVDGTAVYRFGTALFFANADVFLDDMKRLAAEADPSLHTLVVNAANLGVPDATARGALRKADELLHDRGIRLVFGNARRPLREALEKAGSFTLIGEHEFLFVMSKLHPAF